MIKQHSSETYWKDQWDNAVRLHKRSEILEIKYKAESIISNIYDKYSIVAYSGGKDSLVLRHLVENCIDSPKFVCCILQNEFPSFEEWLYDTCHQNTKFVYDEKLGLDFLNKNLEYLFPHGKKEKDAYVHTWHEPTYKYMMLNGYTKILTGRRIQDGNFCGGMNECGCRVSNRKTVNTYNVISSWTHSQLLAYIRYFEIQLPEIYSYPNGFRFGTHPWTERRRLNMCYFDTFDEIISLDKSILINAAQKLDIVKDYFDYLNGKPIERK